MVTRLMPSLPPATEGRPRLDCVIHGCLGCDPRPPAEVLGDYLKNIDWKEVRQYG